MWHKTHSIDPTSLLKGQINEKTLGTNIIWNQCVWEERIMEGIFVGPHIKYISKQFEDLCEDRKLLEQHSRMKLENFLGNNSIKLHLDSWQTSYALSVQDYKDSLSAFTIGHFPENLGAVRDEQAQWFPRHYHNRKTVSEQMESIKAGSCLTLHMQQILLLYYYKLVLLTSWNMSERLCD